MTRFITNTQVCGNCIQILDVEFEGKRRTACAMHHHLVTKSDPFCLDFTWTGITESPKQLIRFSQGERELSAIM